MRKLVLVGHSWGAILGLHVIRLRPELFHAFVGTGQPVSVTEILESSYLAMQGAALGPSRQPANAAAADWFSARSFSLSKLMPFVGDFDARAAGQELPVPYFVIQGRDDSRTPPEAARAFVSQVRAPATGYAEIEGGHFACFTHPTEFLNALESHMRRLGTRSSRQII
jgi:pimeloyl-ACP methyl ester carboxylesterase